MEEDVGGRFTTTVEVAVEDATHARLPAMRLRVVEGPDAGASVAFAGERLVVGTHDSADMILRDRAVSRFHCELAVDGNRVAVRDLGSTNGTAVNDVAVERAWLKDGAVITVGRTGLVFELRGEPSRVALSRDEHFGPLAGRSVAMRAVFARLERVAPTEATVLVEGETGTGKELVAEAIHAASPRHKGPFVVVDCASLPPQLIESELFGHEKGAFTGADRARAGAFETARGGTIFLDELGELPQDLQPKLLRVLEKREVKRVGASTWQPVDVRVVAATNRDLRAEVNAKRFREDLYFRLAVVQVRLPPLRERPEDIPLLVEKLLESLGAKDSPDAALVRDPALARHPWPGNVRELRNHVERTLALREAPELPAAEPAPAEDLRAAREAATRQFERRWLEELLARASGNVSAAARAAGIDRKHLYRLLWRNGLR